ncbi:ATP-dependent DNA helicase [Hydrogenophaga sp.]|uniref:ATP-dependent DNA helicase n=1 Tax=Hydrogenophaga sp. TaxID=1904254 RepID=UPI00272B07EA|nr:ATP-dependent DNA helicase [Hydrogenophaga sp.]
MARGDLRLQQREGQIEMARLVAHAITLHGSLVVEAGTGVGKTFAYLVPLLLSGQRAVLSTATHVLQAQLAQRDIPAVTRLLGIPVRVAVLKGRSSYVCLHRLEQACQENGGRLRDPALSVQLENIRHWARGSQQGDFSELDGWDGQSQMAALAGSTTENCLRSACPRVADCHYLRAKRQAASADWVVLNHHLFFAETTGRRSGDTSLLTGRGVVVFDEAHHLNEVGTQQLAAVVGTRQLNAFARDLVNQGKLWAQGLRPWSHLAMSIGQAVRLIEEMAGSAGLSGRRSRWDGAVPSGLDGDAWARAAIAMDTALRSAYESLRGTASSSPDLGRLLERAHDLVVAWRRLARGRGPDGMHEVCWIDWGEEGVGSNGWALMSGPSESADFFQQLMDGPEADATGWIFTSATLGHDTSLSWFTERLGLKAREGVQTAQIPSPFHRVNQMALFVPRRLPMPSEPAHSIALADAIANWASQLGGRTLVLTTTRKAAYRIAHRLRWQVARGGCEVLNVLDESMCPRAHLLQRFRDAGAPSLHDCDPDQASVLVSSMAFWEGIDLTGDVLQLLVIDKLPFPPPDDPVMEARSRQLSIKGLDPFVHGLLSETKLTLKQGVGRLIRSADDRGIAVIGDKRLLLREYGPQLLAILPPHRQLMDDTEMMAELASMRLTRPSTRDPKISGSPG